MDNSENTYVRVTAGYRREKRTFVLEQPPYPNVGETLRLPDGTELEVRKVEKMKGPVYHVDFPKKVSC